MADYVPTLTDRALIQIGSVDLYYATVPADTTARDLLIPAAQECIDDVTGWNRIGNVAEGIQIARTVGDVVVKADVDLSPVFRQINNLELDVTGELIEIDFDILKILSGIGELVIATAPGASQEGLDTMQIGASGAAFTTYAIAWDGLSHQGWYERGILWECRLMINGNRRRQRAGEERIPFSCAPLQRGDLLDDTKGYGSLGCEQRMTAEATS